MGPNFRDWPAPGPSFNQRFSQATGDIEEQRAFSMLNPFYKREVFRALGILPPGEGEEWNSEHRDNKTYNQEMKEPNPLGELLNLEKQAEHRLNNPRVQLREIPPNMGYYLDPVNGPRGY